MTSEKLYEAIGDISDDKIKEAKHIRKAKRPVWIKWGAMAACLCLVVSFGISIFLNKDTEQTSVGGIMRTYKDVALRSAEYMIEWPWEYKTEYEKFSTIIYEGKEYSLKTSRRIADKTLIGNRLGFCEAIGYDIYTEKEYRQDVAVWQINGISEDLMIAAEMEEQFYVFKYNEYAPPATFGEVLDHYSLSQTLALNKFSVYREGEETGYYRLEEDAYIWQVLEKCREVPFVEDESGWHNAKDHITFTATSESLGVYNRVFYVFADGYISTNIFDWRYTFYIGEDAAVNIISYAKENGIESKREPYNYTLIGTLTEIGDDYILVDDSVLCTDENDGMVFKVLTSDPRISRCIDFEKISTGSIVVIQFTEPVNVETGNVVSDAYSMVKGTFYEREIIVSE